MGKQSKKERDEQQRKLDALYYKAMDMSSRKDEGRPVYGMDDDSWLRPDDEELDE